MEITVKRSIDSETHWQAFIGTELVAASPSKKTALKWATEILASRIRLVRVH